MINNFQLNFIRGNISVRKALILQAFTCKLQSGRGGWAATDTHEDIDASRKKWRIIISILKLSLLSKILMIKKKTGTRRENWVTPAKITLCHLHSGLEIGSFSKLEIFKCTALIKEIVLRDTFKWGVRCEQSKNFEEDQKRCQTFKQIMTLFFYLNDSYSTLQIISKKEHTL